MTDTLFIGYAIIALVYLFPFWVAAGKHHHNSAAILALNVLLGWTILGWIGAFVWACTSVRTVE